MYKSRCKCVRTTLEQRGSVCKLPSEPRATRIRAASELRASRVGAMCRNRIGAVFDPCRSRLQPVSVPCWGSVGTRRSLGHMYSRRPVWTMALADHGARIPRRACARLRARVRFCVHPRARVYPFSCELGCASFCARIKERAALVARSPCACLGRTCAPRVRGAERHTLSACAILGAHNT